MPFLSIFIDKIRNHRIRISRWLTEEYFVFDRIGILGQMLVSYLALKFCW